MANPYAFVFVVLLGAMLWGFIRRSEREFRRGYLLAIEHLEQMTRPGRLGSCELDEAIAKLREETGAKRSTDR